MAQATDSAPAMLLGLADIAVLTRVRRPVVTTWRRRAADRTPFPAPTTVSEGREMFDAAAVLDWLDASGLGNNVDARADLAAFAAVAGAPHDEERVFAGLTALVCLQAVAGPLPRSGPDLLDLADEVDPDDVLLYAEVDALGERLEPLAQYAGLLIDAAYHPAAAFESLMSRRRRTPLTGHARAAVTPATRGLVAATALALAAQAGLTSPVFADPTGSELLVELAARAGDHGPVTVATSDTEDGSARLDRRRLRVHDLVREPLRADGDGGFTVPDEGVLILQFPTPDRPDMSDLDVLRAIDDVVLGSGDRHPVVVVGPARALVDGLRAPRTGPGRPRRGELGQSAAARQRDDILRSNRVRAIVHLPPGCVVRSPRQRLAMWCLGPSAEQRAESRVLTADLADTALTDDVIDDLVTDVTAAVQGGSALGAHALRFGRPEFTRTLLTRSGSLVAPLPHGGRAEAAATLSARIDDGVAQVAAPLPPAPAPQVVARQGAGPSVTTIGAALARREMRLLRGHRLNAPITPSERGARIIDPAVIAGGVARTIDRLELAARFPQTSYTEPGDIVFCTSPRPAAIVDDVGGSVVAYPARVLRSRSPRLVPAVVASDINARPPDARAWRTWTIRQTSPEQADALASHLAEITRYRAELARRFDDLDDLAAALVQGVADGSLDLTVKE
jgi:hypothetical protein